MSDIMYRVSYYAAQSSLNVLFKEFETSDEAFKFSMKLPINSVLEIKYYENSDNYRPTFWSQE